MSKAAAPRRMLVGVYVAALALRAVIGLWTNGRGDMEGLADRARLLVPAVFAQYIALALWIERLVFHRPVEDSSR